MYRLVAFEVGVSTLAGVALPAGSLDVAPDMAWRDAWTEGQRDDVVDGGRQRVYDAVDPGVLAEQALAAELALPVVAIVDSLATDWGVRDAVLAASLAGVGMLAMLVPVLFLALSPAFLFRHQLAGVAAARLVVFVLFRDLHAAPKARQRLCRELARKAVVRWEVLVFAFCLAEHVTASLALRDMRPHIVAPRRKPTRNLFCEPRHAPLGFMPVFLVSKRTLAGAVLCLTRVRTTWVSLLEELSLAVQARVRSRLSPVRRPLAARMAGRIGLQRGSLSDLLARPRTRNRTAATTAARHRLAADLA